MLIEYIDFIATTKRILRDYEDKIWQLEQYKKQIKEIDGDMTSAKNKVLSSVRVSGGSSQSEDVLVKKIDKKILLEKGLKKVNHYTDVFLPAWERLTEEERYLLSERYVHPRRYKNACGEWVISVVAKLHISRSEAYRRSDDALERLTNLLWGSC